MNTGGNFFFFNYVQKLFIWYKIDLNLMEIVQNYIIYIDFYFLLKVIKL